MIRSANPPSQDFALKRTGMSANGKTVLLVEDNEDNRIVYSTILRLFGYTVTEALMAKRESPRLVRKSPT